MFGRANWDKLPKYIFENFEITWVKRGQFQNFQKSREWLIHPKNRPNETCGYLFIAPNQQTICIETNVLQQRAITK